jgi:hypothetical protein
MLTGIRYARAFDSNFQNFQFDLRICLMGLLRESRQL